MSDCGVCLSGGDSGDWDFAIDDISTVTLDIDKNCYECGRLVPAGSPIEEASCYDNEDDDENGDPIPPHQPLYTCLVCAEIATAFYCDGRVWGSFWDAMDEVFDGLNSSCFDKLTTPAAKSELQRRWMKWKGLV